MIADRLNLSGCLALVTGASSGFGEHFAKLLSQQGADLVLAARRIDKLKALAEAIEVAGGKALAVAMDVTDPASVAAAFAAIEAQYKRPCDIIINNSGVGQTSWMVDTTEEEWSSIVDTNLSGVWRVAQQAAKALISAETPGNIVNIASITARRPGHMISGYGASKAAVEQLTRNMALELARSNIRVNAIAPGYFKTGMTGDYLDSAEGDRMRKRIALKRFGEYSDLDFPLLTLVSDAGAYLTGTTFVVDGGHTLVSL